MIRTVQELKKLRVNDEQVIQLELCKAKLPDATTFDKYMILEQQVAAQTLTNPDDESPFPGITIGRVTEVMMTSEYEACARICDPGNRVGLTGEQIEEILYNYTWAYPDCAPHFPKWVD